MKRSTVRAYEKSTSLADAPMGKEYQECYNVAVALPAQEHFDMYRRVKDELVEMGIEFPY